MSFSENLQFLREREGMTQECLAERLAVSRQSVSKWESASSYPEMEKLLTMCDLFHVDLDTLLRGDARQSSVEDSAQYDRHMNWFSGMIAGGVGLVLMGVTVFLGLCGFAVQGHIAIAVLLTMIAVAVMLFIVAGIRHDHFAKQNPVIPLFYSQEELDGFARKFPFLIAAPVVAILIGVVWLVLCGEQAELAGEWAEIRLVAAFLLDITVSVTILVWAGIQYSKYDLEAWNRDHDPSPEAVARRKKVDWISGIIMLLATAIYLLVGFGAMALNNDYGSYVGWQWGWIGYPVGGVLCGVAETYINRNA